MMYCIEKGMIRGITLNSSFNLSCPVELYMFPTDGGIPNRVKFCPYCGTKTDLVDFDNDPEELKAENERIRKIEEESE